MWLFQGWPDLENAVLVFYTRIQCKIRWKWQKICPNVASKIQISRMSRGAVGFLWQGFHFQCLKTHKVKSCPAPTFSSNLTFTKLIICIPTAAQNWLFQRRLLSCTENYGAGEIYPLSFTWVVYPNFNWMATCIIRFSCENKMTKQNDHENTLDLPIYL